jgi:Ni/Fe-hydrogenase subunit HybB-like protein
MEQTLTYQSIDDTVLDTLSTPRRSYWVVVALLFAGILMGAGCWTYQILVGIGVAGQNNPVHWGTYLINFVFWVGIAHSGTLISAILHLFRAGWRNPIARAAETMTVFAVCTAGLYPFIHLGRVWMVYYMLPVPNQRTLWPNFQSPLMFDVVAISTYLTVSSLFWYTGMLPDLATIRDRAHGVRRKFLPYSPWAGPVNSRSGATIPAATSFSPPWPPRWSSRCTAWSPGILP